MKTLNLLLVLTLATSTALAQYTPLLEPAEPVKKGAVRLLKTNQDAMQARADLVVQAQHEITAEYYTVGSDWIAMGGLILLRDAARRGIKVRVLVDALMNGIPDPVMAILRAEAPNMEIKEYNPLNAFDLDEAFNRLHDKALCIDYGKVCISGGRNISAKYFVKVTGTNYNDLDAVYDGPAAKYAYDYFEKLWRGDKVQWPRLGIFDPEEMQKPCFDDEHTDCQAIINDRNRQLKKYNDIFTKMSIDLANGNWIIIPSKSTNWLEGYETKTNAIFLSDDPESKKNENGISLALNKILREKAQTKLVILSPYVVLTKRAEALLQDLRNKGVEIKILTNSLNASDNVIAQRAYIDTRKTLLKMGIELWEYKGPDTMHAKAGVMNDNIALVGSYNFDLLSNKKNLEIGIVVEDEQVSKNLLEYVDELQQNSYQIGPDGKAINDDGNYGKAATWKKVSIQAVKVLRPFIRFMKGESRKPIEQGTPIPASLNE